MSLDLPTLAAILAMAFVTYAIRIAGLLLVRRLTLGPRAMAILDAVPGCVLVAVIAPAALTRSPADTAAAIITALAALRLPLIAVVATGVLTAGLLRTLAG